MVNENLIFLSGLPRTGSSLLASILTQNTDIHFRGNSAVCQLMHDVRYSCEGDSYEQLHANGERLEIQKSILSKIPSLYHLTDCKYVVDKCRCWTERPNIRLIVDYLVPRPKIIVMIRPIDEIIKSFVKLRNKNNWAGKMYSDLLRERSQPVMRPYNGVLSTATDTRADYLYIQYKHLVADPRAVMDRLYEFLEIPKHEYSFDGIEPRYKEADDAYSAISLEGLHDVRPEISIEKNNVKLSSDIQEVCDEMTAFMFKTLGIQND